MEQLRLSYSSLNTFESCPRKLELDKLYPRLPRADDAFAADVGKALHAAYQNYLIHHDVDQATWTLLQEYPFRLEFNESNDYRSMEATLATLEEMFESVDMMGYELAKIKKPDGTVAPAIEVPFEIRFKGLNIDPCPAFPDGAAISFVGYIDAIMRNLMTDMYRTLDIKTHRRFLKDATPKYLFDTQQIPYGLVIEHIAGNPITQFEVLYLDCLIDVAEPRVQLYPFLKTEDDLQEWLLIRVMQLQTIQRYVKGDFFPRTSGGCLFYNRPCRYLDVCQSRDRESLTQWFLDGSGLEAAAPQEPFEPWIVADIEPFAGE